MHSAEKYLKAHNRKKVWHRIVSCLACVVVFCTTYALILPAITLEKDTCEIPEHTHSESCYTQVTSVQKTVPVCTGETLNLHRHGSGCYGEDGSLICGYADFVVHYHDSSCYGEDGSLWCTLPEASAHTHSDGCYALPEGEAPHSHGEACYTTEPGALTCTEHVHEEACFTETDVLICTLEEQEGHEHGEDCQDEAGEMVCALEASKGHHHGDGCYEAQREQICGIESDHRHSDACYAWNEVLICDLSTEPSETVAEPVLVCGKREVILHEHTPGCLDESGSLICGKTQVLSHQHTDACFEPVEEPVDTEALTCTLPEEEGHTHTAQCYGTWELTCGVEEHTHTEDCGAAEETETTAATEETTEPQETTVQTTGPEETTEPEDTTEPTDGLPGMEIDSGLPVMGTAYATGTGADPYSLMTLEDTPAPTNPLQVDAYIEKATLCYRPDENADWTNVEGATNIPGDADFKLTINYKEVPIDDLLAADGKMTYELPTLLRNAKTNGSITSGGKAVGTITVEDGKATLVFDKQWLNDKKSENNTVIDGDFFVEAEANLSEIEEGKPGQIVIGDTKIDINFAGDLIAQYGNVDLSKAVQSTVSEDESGDYLIYTLTVTAGPDGCPDVKVVDTFANTAYIEEYVGVTGTATNTNGADGLTETGGTGSVYIGGPPTEAKPIPGPAGENATKPGTLVWVIGDMKANETRTLTYRVKLKEGYTGAMPKDSLQNTANVYSKTYQRDTDTVTFTPKAEGTLSKVASNFVSDNNGGGTITYTIWVHALETNTYTLDNVKIMDALDGSVENRNSTLPAIRQYLSYDKTSFHLYKGGAKDQNGSDQLTEIENVSGLKITDTDGDKKYNDSFTYYVGPLAPGESKTLTYSVKVEPGVFMAAGNEAAVIHNRACIYTDDTREDGIGKLNGYNTDKTLDRKAWSRKLAGQKQTADSTVTMSGDVYDLTGGSVSEIDNPGSFTVPAGSYQYQVSANEAGDWDLSSASLKDTLGGEHMAFVGYVRVDAYTISENAPASSLEDSAALSSLSGRTPTKTVWVKVDSLTSFAFTPEQLGLTGKQAYLLTYYAQPKNIDGITQVLVRNDFNLSGTVGIGDVEYTLAGINVAASVIVEGSNSFSAVKQSWYYEAPKVTEGDFAKGALYWAIKVDGKVLPKDIAIKDVTNASGGESHRIWDGSLVGVYTGSLGETPLTDYPDMAALTSGSSLTALGSDCYAVQTSENHLQLTLQKEISLGQGDSLYIIVKTEPSKLPETKRDAFVYNNKLQTSDDGGNWVDHNVASKTLYGSENIFKELGRVFTYSGIGSDITIDQEGTKQDIATSALGGAGTFVAWQIHLNYEGSLSGRYRVVEQIPQGMEVTYVRLWWVGNKAVNQNPRPTFVQISEADLGDGWTPHEKTMGSTNAGTHTNHYYTKGQQVIWDVDNLVAGGGTRDDYAVEIQIVCRVTDPEVLLGGASKEFNNVVSLQNANGDTIGQDGNGVTIGKKTLSKTGTYDENVNGGRYPFKITLNELGEDLVKGSDTITLVDELSDTLILDTASIQVVNTKTEETVPYTASMEGQTLKITLPDDQPLTVTYETTINAAPGQTITISNNAHWEGYTTPSGGSVKKENFSYATGGTVGASGTPSVTVKKVDQYDTGKLLPGAQFQLEEGTYENGVFTPKKDGLTLTDTTGADGTLTFGKGSDQIMHYNTVYCLTETKAPEGYILDTTPHYFAVASKLNSDAYPEFPKGVTVWYLSPEYTYQAYNHKGEATVTKAFQDAAGGDLAKINGTYRFGIYTEANPTDKPLQTVTITYANNTVTPAGGVAKFTNLDLGKTYYIYELDDSGQPIVSGGGTVSGMPFLVTYSAPSVTVSAESPTAAVTVTNRVNYPELPNTGGAGTKLYTAGGGLLAMAALLLLYNQRKRRREGHPTF